MQQKKVTADRKGVRGRGAVRDREGWNVGDRKRDGTGMIRMGGKDRRGMHSVRVDTERERERLRYARVGETESEVCRTVSVEKRV